MSIKSLKSRLTVTVAIASLVALLAGCGGSVGAGGAASQATAAGPVIPNSPLAGKTITVVVQYDWAPLMWKDDNGNETGYLYDVIAEAAGRLGATVKLTSADFASVVPSIQSGKFDVGLGTDATPERQQVVDVVPFVRAGYRFLTKASGGHPLGNSMSDLCGVQVATVASNSIIPDIQKQSATCTQQGKPAIAMTTFPDVASARLAVKSGRADVTDTYTGDSGWVVRNDQSWMVTGPEFNDKFGGFVVNKQTGHADAWANAINQIINDPSGIYRKILDKYGVANAVAITTSVVNPTT